jgi:hypothetical protein
MWKFVVCAALLEQSGTLVDASGDLAGALRSARAQWLRETQFRCRYRLMSGVVGSVDEAFNDQVRRAQVKELRTGAHIRKGGRQRISCEYPEPSEVVSVVDSQGVPVDVDLKRIERLQAGQNVLVRNSGFDELSDTGRSLIYRPLYKQAIFCARNLDEVDIAAGGCTEGESELSPFNPTRACEMDIFFATGQQKFDVGTILGIMHIDDAHIVTVSRSRREEATHIFEQITRLTWWTAPSVPVVEQIERSITLNGMPLVTHRVRLSDFVACPGGNVPKNVVYASIDNGKERASTDVLVWEWLSTDLGDAPPTDADFVLSVPASTIVIGLKKPPPPGTDRELTLEMYDEQNRILPISALSARTRGAESGAGTALSTPVTSTRVTRFLYLNGVLLLGLALFLYLRHRFRRHKA